MQTIVSETLPETLQAIDHSDDTEGIFMQELIGKREVGHIALVAGGEVFPLVTNQEYKWKLDGNQGEVLGYPMGGIVQVDTDDQYGLVTEVIRPLEPWLKKTCFCGPIQVTAGYWEDRWQVIEYNVRIGITSGPLMMEMLSLIHI